MNTMIERYTITSLLRAGEGGGDISGGAPSGDPAPGVSDAAPGVTTLLGSDDEISDPAAKPAATPEAKPGDVPAEYVEDPAKTPEENAAAKEAFDKAKTDKAKDAPIDPASYTFEPLPGETLDPVVEGEFRKWAAEKRLSQDDVNNLTGMQRKLSEESAKRLADNVGKWGDELRADKEVGGPDFKQNTAAARLAIKTFFPPSLVPVLNKTGMGSYPDFVRGMVRIGKLMGEHSIVPGGGGTKESAVDILYPETGSD